MRWLNVHADLILAALNAAVVVVIVVQLRRARMPLNSAAIALVSFFALRVLSRMVDAPQLPIDSESGAVQLIDLLSILVLMYLLTQTGRIVRAMQYEHRETQLRGQEYERARHHYTQVVRHRVLNPVTVIRGTLLTLRDDVEMAPPTRRELCEKALEATEAIEHVTLEPERRDSLEREFDALPNVESRRRR